MRRASSAEVAKPCGDVGMPALATIFRDSYSKNLMGGGSLSWGRMRLLFACFLVLLFPGSAAAADLSLALSTDAGVQFSVLPGWHSGHSARRSTRVRWPTAFHGETPVSSRHRGATTVLLDSRRAGRRALTDSIRLSNPRAGPR